MATLDETEIKEFQQAFPQLVSDLSPAALKKLLDSCAVTEFRPGRNIMRDRMPSDAIYFVLEGEARVFIENDNQSIKLGNIKPGQILGEISILSRQLVSSASVEAATPMKTLKLRHQPLEDLLVAEDTGPALLNVLTEVLAARLRTPH